MGIYKSWNEPRLRLTDGAITKRDQGENGINEQGVTDQSIDELNNVLEIVKKKKRPMLIDCVIDKEEGVYPIVPPGKSIQELVLEWIVVNNNLLNISG